jgi:hypothetical protein
MRQKFRAWRDWLDHVDQYAVGIGGNEMPLAEFLAAQGQQDLTLS